MKDLSTLSIFILPLSITIGGRTGINAISFNTIAGPGNPASGTMLETIINGTTLTGANTSFAFHASGLNSSGCDGSGAFFCFDNTLIPPTPASPLITGEVTLVFDATLISGSWTGYGTALKIDWVGPNQNNCSLVSQDIPVNLTCPDCAPGTTSTPVSEPGSLALLAIGSVGSLFGLTWLRRRQDKDFSEGLTLFLTREPSQ
jgi:hypothetical protein